MEIWWRSSRLRIASCRSAIFRFDLAFVDLVAAASAAYWLAAAVQMVIDCLRSRTGVKTGLGAGDPTDMPRAQPGHLGKAADGQRALGHTGQRCEADKGCFGSHRTDAFVGDDGEVWQLLAQPASAPASRRTCISGRSRGSDCSRSARHRRPPAVLHPASMICTSAPPNCKSRLRRRSAPATADRHAALRPAHARRRSVLRPHRHRW